ncbi:kinase-like protein [Wolfiporia cocos MD-104 SS10]|uniref:non-specific serine/threonine protein kinase n=1 Tax=Wolfiporia cocos (strain MD-104) TaxID=742152 RepID=A0A2H3JAR2_WOLCO|nr:kinase-like protein [Wolfiporia cocos MD-104 SS10]
MASPLDQYEPLDIIGTGSFGIIRKVRRKADGVVSRVAVRSLAGADALQIFARKELNFERMSERDRKQIVSEVNILKDLHHEHIVRYHDRHVDRDAGVLYILMEYCGGGDLASVIKQAQRHSRPIPEDTVWNYFMQILLALNHCHHPQVHGRGSDVDGREKRAQILHRDIKPDNIFLDENHIVKLGDFGLSKALVQASFANTYVGTPYYMSPELMQEKAYDSKSDIWSLGCLIYELCALKPPFHEAKTHAELSILIRNGRIPPLPKGYSTSLSNVIKSMLNLNPAMRPSAAQLLAHERLDLAFKVNETQKLLTTVKSHKATLQARERDLAAREAAAAEREAKVAAALQAKDDELAALRVLLAQAEAAVLARIREAVARRDEELRAMVLAQERDVAARIARREEEIMEAVRRREEEIERMWVDWEAKTRRAMEQAVEERMVWVRGMAAENDRERERLDGVRLELERKMAAMEENASANAYGGDRKGTAPTRPKGKTPLEEVKNILAPLARLAASPEATPVKAAAALPPVLPASTFETPRAAALRDPPPSAMKGVILTATGEPVATPTPAELRKLFADTPRVGLNFTKIFDFSERDDAESDADGYQTDTRPPPPQARRRSTQGGGSASPSEDGERTPQQAVRPTRMRRPSIRRQSQGLVLPEPEPRRSSPEAAAPQPSSSADAASARPATTARRRLSRVPSSSGSGTTQKTPASAAASSSGSEKRTTPPSAPSSSSSTETMSSTSSGASSSSGNSRTANTVSFPLRQPPPPVYDLSDEENLPSPFLKKADREAFARTASAPAPPAPAPSGHQQANLRVTARKSTATLRAMAVVNSAATTNSATTQAAAKAGTFQSRTRTAAAGTSAIRPSIAKAHKASEEARKTLFRP